MTKFIDENLGTILEALVEIQREDLVKVVLNAPEEEQEKMIKMMLKGINNGLFVSNKTNFDKVSKIMTNGITEIDNLCRLDAFETDSDTGESNLQVTTGNLEIDCKYSVCNMEREAEKNLSIKTGKTTSDISIEKWCEDNHIDIDSFKTAAQKKKVDIKKIKTKKDFLSVIASLKI